MEEGESRIKSRHHHEGAEEIRNTEDELIIAPKPEETAITTDEVVPYEGPPAMCLSLPALWIAWEGAERIAKFDAPWRPQTRAHDFLLKHKTASALLDGAILKAIADSSFRPNPFVQVLRGRRKAALQARIQLQIVPQIRLRGQQVSMGLDGGAIRAGPTRNGFLSTQALHKWTPPTQIAPHVPTRIVKAKHNKSHGVYWILCPCWGLTDRGTALLHAQNTIVAAAEASERDKFCSGFTLPALPGSDISCASSLPFLQGLQKRSVTFFAEESESSSDSDDDEPEPVHCVFWSSFEIEVRTSLPFPKERSPKDTSADELFRASFPRDDKDAAASRRKKTAFLFPPSGADLLMVLIDRSNPLSPVATCVVPH